MQGNSYAGGLSTKPNIHNLKLGKKQSHISGHNRRTIKEVQHQLRNALETSDKLEAKRWLQAAYSSLGSIRL